MAAVVALAAVLAACGDARRPSAAHAGRAVDAPAPAGRTQTLERARDELIRDCMRRRGFDYPPPARGAARRERLHPYVLTDVAWARRHGYGGDVRARVEAE
ncbi:MAG TPA: hypothetical protein VFG79_10760, partial [Solirubrobacter sp.]|nr:hypothetical protein [Solirubrobacter sp.]